MPRHPSHAIPDKLHQRHHIHQATLRRHTWTAGRCRMQNKDFLQTKLLPTQVRQHSTEPIFCHCQAGTPPHFPTRNEAIARSQRHRHSLWWGITCHRQGSRRSRPTEGLLLCRRASGKAHPKGHRLRRLVLIETASAPSSPLRCHPLKGVVCPRMRHLEPRT